MQISLITLGCPKNLVDAEHMLGALSDAGHDLVGDPSAADVIIVNTCSFIASAVQESLAAIREVLDLRSTGWNGRVIVAGCLPERYGRKTFDLAPGVDAVVGCSSVERIVETVGAAIDGRRACHIAEHGHPVDGRLPRILGTPRHIAYLRISEGCDNRCAYCVIPSIRGPLVSRPLDDIITEAEELAAVGVRELVPIAQDTTAYGMDIASTSALPELLRRLDVLGFTWIRLLYAHPARVSDELLDALSETEHVARYLDVPIQHIADGVLAGMRRGTDGRFLRQLVDRIRSRVPGMSLRTSVIVGFPGEGDTEFDELRSFLDEGCFDHVGVFEYSPEEGSPAYSLHGGAEAPTVRQRAELLIEDACRRALERGRDLVGSDVEVLIDEAGPTAVGRTEQLAWELDGVVAVGNTPGELEAGELVTVRITGARDFDLVGSYAGRLPDGAPRPEEKTA